MTCNTECPLFELVMSFLWHDRYNLGQQFFKWPMNHKLTLLILILSRLSARNPRWVSWSTNWHARFSGVSSIHVMTWLLQEFFPPLLDEPKVPWSELSVWYFMTRPVNNTGNNNSTNDTFLLSCEKQETADAIAWRRTCHRRRSNHLLLISLSYSWYTIVSFY
jgi:hypothetical protein